MLSRWFATFGAWDWVALVVGIVFAVLALDLAVAAFRAWRTQAWTVQADDQADDVEVRS